MKEAVVAADTFLSQWQTRAGRAVHGKPNTELVRRLARPPGGLLHRLKAEEACQLLSLSPHLVPFSREILRWVVGPLCGYRHSSEDYKEISHHERQADSDKDARKDCFHKSSTLTRYALPFFTNNSSPNRVRLWATNAFAAEKRGKRLVLNRAAGPPLQERRPTTPTRTSIQTIRAVELQMPALFTSCVKRIRDWRVFIPSARNRTTLSIAILPLRPTKQGLIKRF